MIYLKPRPTIKMQDAFAYLTCIFRPVVFGFKPITSRLIGRLICCIFILSISAIFNCALAQAPVITPKSPVVLALDKTGNRTITPGDVATVTTTDGSVPVVTVSPLSFNCASLGRQMVTVTATANQADPSAVSFSNVISMVFDPAGDLILSDYTNNDIRVISKSGKVTTIESGDGSPYSDGSGHSNHYGIPGPLAVDKAGNLYYASNDEAQHTIYKVTPAGVVSIIISEYATSNVSTDGTVATATLTDIAGMVFDDAGNLFFTEGDDKIRKITPDGNVITIAGSPMGFSGFKDGTGGNVLFDFPSGITIDAAGDLFVADRDNAAIRKITQQGVVTTLAGGTFGFKDGRGTAAQFLQMIGLTIDRSGNLYVADDGNSAIRKITPDGTVTTIAGNGAAGFNNGTGAAATFLDPLTLAADANGNVFIDDRGNDVIRKIDANGVVTTYAGSGAQGDNNGNIFGATGPSSSLQVPVTVVSTPVFAAYPNLSVPLDKNCRATVPDFSVNPQVTDVCSGVNIHVTQSPVAGTSFSLNAPVTVTLTANDGYGGMATTSFTVSGVDEPLITPKTGPIVLPLDPTGHYIVLLSDVATVTGCSQTPNITLSPGTFTCADLGNQFVTVTASYGTGAAFNYPAKLSVDPSGNIYASDMNNIRVRKISPAGRVSTLAGSGATGSQDGQGSGATFSRGLFGIANDSQGNTFVWDVANNLIRKITPAGVVTAFDTNLLLQLGNNGTGNFSGQAIAIDKLDNIYIGGETLIIKITPAGTASIFAKNGMLNPSGNGTTENFYSILDLTTDAAGNVYALNAQNNVNTIYKIAPNGSLGTLAALTSTTTDFAGLAVDSHGNVFTGSAYTQIYKISPAGDLSLFAGSNAAGSADGKGVTASFNTPEGLAIDAADNLYVADSNNNEIRKIKPDGTVTTLAGTPTAGYADGTARPVTTTLKIPVTITSSLRITSPFPDVFIPVNGSCPTLLPNYLPPATASDNCSNNIVFTQTPGFSTPVNGTNPITVVITATDDLNNTASVSFKATPQTTPPPAPALSVTASSTTICDGTNVTFIATPSNMGANPAYQWQVNGVNTGSNQPSYASATLRDKDVITCIATSSSGCLTTVTSNAVTMQVNSNVTPTISIFATDNPVCAGTNDSFYVNVTNQGNSPSFQWQLNGVNAGNQATYSNANLADGDRLTCILTNNDPSCLASPTATSNTIVINVLPMVTPSVSINATPAGAVCAGAPLSFTAVTQNAGSPAFQWLVNNVSSGTGPSFSSVSLNEGDVVTCQINSPGNCQTTTTAVSAPYVVHITPLVTPVVTIMPQNVVVCEGTPVNFTASLNTPVSGATFQWQVNGVNAGTNSSAFTANDLHDGDQVSCAVSANGSCLTPANSQPQTVHVNAVPQITLSSTITLKRGSSVQLAPAVTGNITAWQWSPAAGLDDPAIATPVASPLVNTTYTLLVTSSDNCQNTARVSINLTEPIGDIPNTFTPNNDGVNDTWNIASLLYYANCTVDIFDRYGQAVYHSVGYTKPWDGTLNEKKLPVGTYYYIIDLKNGTKASSGYVTIIR